MYNYIILIFNKTIKCSSKAKHILDMDHMVMGGLDYVETYFSLIYMYSSKTHTRGGWEMSVEASLTFRYIHAMEIPVVKEKNRQVALLDNYGESM